ncbi:neurobeachin-like protein 1 [Corticium candelabrum]|uniref:neurobeachin-like protein 1 n=1 Tax=Corticium candelabrum TaxID=121492 RepID=UPI002E2EC7B2|nr:neurobeachin-like protein 1 [Corticium candelabrum]
MLDFWIAMLNSVRFLMSCNDVAALQAMFVNVGCFQRMIEVLSIAQQNASSKSHQLSQLCVAVVKAVATVMGDSVSAK